MGLFDKFLNSMQLGGDDDYYDDEDDYFDDLVSLMTFNLGANQISSIEPNSFSQLSSVI